MTAFVRPQWVGDGLEGDVPADRRVEGAGLDDFAFGGTDALLRTEPRLVTIIDLVEMAGPMDEAMWREVSVLVATFIGPGRRLPLLGAVTSESASVGALLTGEITRLRFMWALRDLTGQTP